MHVARYPDVSLPDKGLNFSLRVSASTVEVKTAYCVRSSANSLSGASFSPASLAAPLPLLVLGAMAAEGDEG